MVYFSATGSSYPADALTCAAILYYGLKTIYRGPSNKDVLLAVFWCCLGIALRPLSAMWLIPSVCYLIWKNGSRAVYLGSLAVALGSALATVAVYAPAYQSFADLLSTLGPVKDAAQARTGVRLLTSLFRVFGSLIYFYHIWLLFGVLALAKAFSRGFSAREKQVLIFLSLAGLPYLVLLCKCIASAGYLCLLIPIICIFPLLFESLESRRLPVAILFAGISLVQLFYFAPVAPTSIARCVADAYLLQYSRAGIEKSEFHNLADLAKESNIWVDKIPESRR